MDQRSVEIPALCTRRRHRMKSQPQNSVFDLKAKSLIQSSVLLPLLRLLKDSRMELAQLGMAQDRLLPCGSIRGTLSPNCTGRARKGLPPDPRDNDLLRGNINELRECKGSISKPCPCLGAAWKGVCTPGPVPALLPWQRAQGWSCCHHSPLPPSQVTSPATRNDAPPSPGSAFPS